MANKRIRQFPSISSVDPDTYRIAVDSPGGTYVNSILVSNFLSSAQGQVLRISAPGSGYADSRIANALASLASTGGELIFGPGNYEILGDIELRWDGSKDLKLTFDRATIDARGWTAPSLFSVFFQYAEYLGGWRIESAVSSGDTAVTGIPSGVAALLGSDGRGVLAFTPETQGENGAGHGEQAVVWKMTGTTATLGTFLREGYGVGTTVYAWRYPHISIDGARILLTPTTEWSGINLFGTMNPRLTNCYVEGGQYINFGLIQCIGGQIDNCMADALGYNFANGSIYGYGIGPAEGCMLTNSTTRRCKHALATSGYIPAWDVHVENCELETTRDGQGAIGIRTHHSTRNLTLVNVRTHGLSHVGSGHLTVIGGKYTGGYRDPGGEVIAIPPFFLGSQIAGSVHDVSIRDAVLDAGGFGGRDNATNGIYVSGSNTPVRFRRLNIDSCTLLNCGEGIRVVPSYADFKVQIDQMSVTNCNIESTSYPINLDDGLGTTIVKKVEVLGGKLRNINGSTILNTSLATPVVEMSVDSEWLTGPDEIWAQLLTNEEADTLTATGTVA